MTPNCHFVKRSNNCAYVNLI